ncbi:dienelactone hydrolase family protein [Ktedonosporobacter rubrisoli]|uniref:Dienelactone hydrolase family protein n=1 Tax=Ktedonosporobacter rubrisoli TaxID=2509675 RepID=A0A4P6JUX0_KTERU|nr:dienelactone hydrolase family protein [Ktedonosporobacter rubrisoli]QBD79294.1 dienelactone hydrolase family protein [Ktedonosporobacter rubrisoli]
MCYDDNARPPEPPKKNGKARGEDIALTAEDGNRFAAYIAHPEHPSGPQALILPDIRGLHQFYKELALRFAEVGITALAIDYFGRTAGISSRAEPFEFMPHVQKLRLSTLIQDIRAALTYLRTNTGADQPVFMVGFCLGGTLSYMTGTHDLGLTGVIGFYAGISRDFGSGKKLLDVAEQIRYPSLGLFGGADQGIPVNAVHTLDEKLSKAGFEHEVVIYPGAPHGFFDRRSADFAEASADAWRRVLGFIQAHSSAAH